MKRVAIVGVGLIGGSFALALRKAGFSGTLLGVSSPQTIERALGMGVIDRGVSIDEAVESCDLIYLSQPILTILDTLDRIGADVRPGTLVTDAGSTKRLIAEKGHRALGQGCFLGGHPMAGKERSGVREADPDLFRGRTYVLTPADVADLQRKEVQAFRSWLERIGARVVYLEPDEHDRLVAFTSHVPQLLSTAMASVLGDVNGHSAVAGPGIIGLTRLAMSPYGVWRDILQTNQPHIEDALTAVLGRLEEIRRQINSASLEQEFERAAEVARGLREIYDR